MGYAPLGARTDRLADVPRSLLHGIACSELDITSSHRRISALLVRSSSPSMTSTPDRDANANLVVLYLQGNAGNPLHRLPVFQGLIAASLMNPTILAPAPRSYWTSPGRPTQSGILADYTASLMHVLHHFPRARVVLYGHSLGGAIALCLLAQPGLSRLLGKDAARLRGVILENPLASVPSMLAALYPQKWLPYRYLAPFVWDRWDALAAVQEARTAPLLESLCGRMLVLASEHDEVVPNEMGAAIVQAATRTVGSTSSDYGKGVGEQRMGGSEREELLRTRFIVVRGALHEDAWKRKGWAEAVGTYLRGVIDEAESERKAHEDR
ncbi:hypothetical protein C0992_007858 [Termitomyces sp. T32_za158]|nr:hypothetical protein C0992_007858 [Termitomyces sp. T32_za158]